jgi:thioredoxin 1
MTKLTQDNFIESVFATNFDKVTIIEFSANWCGSCKDFQTTTLPQLEQLYSPNNVIFYKVDVDESPELADQHNIDKLPTFLFFKNRQIKNFIIGNESLETFKDTINGIL